MYVSSGVKWVIHNVRQDKVTLKSQGEFFLFFFTIKREVAEESSEQVHDKHGQDGDVGDGLHALLGSTGVEKNQFGEAK